MNSYRYYTTNAGKPPIKDVLEQFYSSRIVKVGKHLKTNCVNHSDTHPSMIVDTKSNRVHCFVCGFDADSWQVLSMATGKSFAELRRERGYVPDSKTIRQRQRLAREDEQLRRRVRLCWIRLAKLYRDTYRAEKKVKEIPTDGNAEFMANVLFLREVLNRLFGKLESDDQDEQRSALQEALDRELLLQ